MLTIEPTTTSAALEALAEALGGDRLAADLREQIERERAGIAETITSYEAGQTVPGAAYVQFQASLREYSACRALGDHARAIVRLTAVLAQVDPEAEPTTLHAAAVDIYNRLMQTRKATEVNRNLIDMWPRLVRQTLEALAKLQSKAEEIPETYGKGGLEETLAQIAEDNARAEKMRARREMLEVDVAEVAAQAEADIRAAIKEAGGPEKLAQAIRASWQAGSRWLEADPGFGQVKAAGERLGNLESQLARVEKGSLLEAALKLEAREVQQQLSEVTRAARTRREAAALDLATRASEGDVTAARELSAVASMVPAAFPKGLGVTLAKLTAAPPVTLGQVHATLAVLLGD